MVFSKGVEWVNKIVRPSYLILCGGGAKVALVSPAYWVPQEAIEQAAETIRS